MAEGGGYEAYHVPQQSRRDKLRVFMAQNNPAHHHLPFFVNNFPVCSSFFPLQDPSSSFTSPLEFLPSPNNSNNFMNPLSVSSITTVPSTVLKSQDFDFEGRVNSDKHYNVMGLLGNSRAINDPTCSKSSSSPSPPCSTTHPTCLEEPQLLQPCFPMNPNNNNPFLFSPHNLQNLSSCSEVVPFKPDHHPLSSNGQGLSLSLSSHYSNSIHRQNHAGLPLELDLRRNDPTISNDQVTWSGGYMVVSGGPNEVSRSSVPVGPFTGYSSILKGSKFLKPAQQLLEELFSKVGGGERSSLEVSSMDPCIDQCVSPSWLVDDPAVPGNKSRLMSMLEEVFKRYRQYYQQIQAVIGSFECVSGLANAAPYANSAVCKHFRSLKNAITDQLQLANKAYGGHRKEDIGPSNHRPLHNSGFVEQRSVWRPQRGLPERAVTVLRTWLFEHFLHPYPTDSDKIMLAKQTGLSRNQVSNWFINARVRLWKPMVEEIHSLEARQAQKDPQRDEQNARRPINQVQNSNSVASCYPSIPNPRVQEVPPKCMTTELPELPVGGEEPVSLSYDNLSSHPHVGVGVSMVGTSSGVSLTLGLHQNDGLGLQESFPLGAISSHWPSP